jgi:hypothetical protein
MLEEGKGKQTFSDEEKVREFVISRPTLKEFLNNFLFFFTVLLFIYAYKAWVIPPAPTPSPKFLEIEKKW